jgi:hypothetical protein
VSHFILHNAFYKCHTHQYACYIIMHNTVYTHLSLLICALCICSIMYIMLFYNIPFFDIMLCEHCWYVCCMHSSLIYVTNEMCKKRNVCVFYRYLVVEINPTAGNKNKFLLKSNSLYIALHEKLRLLHGDFGLAAARSGFLG